MLVIVTALQILYALGVLGLAIYGFNALWLTILSKYSLQELPLRQALASPKRNAPQSTHLPTVTVQLPVFNELHVVERIIDACANLDYPSEKLQIQVLDDSTDQTSTLINRRVDYWQQRGKQIDVVRRADRSGYKGGALAASLPTVRGEFIAIFDADFEPSSSFLLQTLPELYATPSAGFIQARWTHLNADYSPLTRCQALALDGHFMIEQVARQNACYAFGFNGSAGIWRKSCIEDLTVGGWQIDTLTEDLDLSYRAQLAGWTPIYLPYIAAPAEIPPQLSAFKRQQFRWAKGSIQTLRKCASQVLHSEWSFIKQAEAILHLAAYLLHPMLLLILLVMLPCLLLNIDPPWVLTYLTLASAGPPLLYAVAQRRLHPEDWFSRWAYIWLLTLLGFGLCLNNSIAVWEALSGKEGPFLRTPKFHVQSASDRWHGSRYRLPFEPIFWGELFCLLYASVAALLAGYNSNIWAVFFMLLYVGGFGVMIGVELWQFLTVRFGPVDKPIHSLPSTKPSTNQ